MTSSQSEAFAARPSAPSTMRIFGFTSRQRSSASFQKSANGTTITGTRFTHFAGTALCTEKVAFKVLRTCRQCWTSPAGATMMTMLALRLSTCRSAATNAAVRAPVPGAAETIEPSRLRRFLSTPSAKVSSVFVGKIR